MRNNRLIWRADHLKPLKFQDFKQPPHDCMYIYSATGKVAGKVIEKVAGKVKKGAYMPLPINIAGLLHKKAVERIEYRRIGIRSRWFIQFVLYNLR